MFDMGKAKMHLRQREEECRARNRDRWVRASDDFEKIVAMVIERYKPNRLIQWGSLLDENAFVEQSDIDLAVEGVTDAPTYFAMMGDAMEMTDIKVDIVQMEKIEPEFACIIREIGIVIYEHTCADVAK